MHSQNGEEEIFQLDEVFKNNLALIRPHILGIKSITDANLCRIWLEKLSNSSAQEKEIRNSYICSLRMQVEAGVLESPFDSPPPEGPLTSDMAVQRRDEPEQMSSSSWSDFSNTLQQRTCTNEVNFIKSEGEGSYCASQAGINGHCQTQYSKVKKDSEENIPEKALIARYKQAIRFLISAQNKDGDTLNKIEYLQNIYENKITSLKTTLKELQEENARLKKEAEHLHFSKQQIDSTTCEWNLFRTEIDILKSKLAEVQNSKMILEESHKDILSKYQQEISVGISHLHHRLNEAQSKNRKIEMQLQAAVGQLRLYIQQSEERNLAAIEGGIIEKNNVKSIELNKTITNLKNLLALKNQEVKHLEEALKMHCYKMQKEVNFLKDVLKHTCDRNDKKFQAKVCELQKVLDKHSRFKAKLLKNFKYKLTCMDKEKTLEVNGLELQLHIQRAEIVATVSKDKQKELEAEVAKLEERYKEMLIELERKYIACRDEDQKKISQLETTVSSLTCKIKSLESN